MKKNKEEKEKNELGVGKEVTLINNWNGGVRKGASCEGKVRFGHISGTIFWEMRVSNSYEMLWLQM